MNLPYEELINERKSIPVLQFKLYTISILASVTYTKNTSMSIYSAVMLSLN